MPISHTSISTKIFLLYTLLCTSYNLPAKFVISTHLLRKLPFPKGETGYLMMELFHPANWTYRQDLLLRWKDEASSAAVNLPVTKNLYPYYLVCWQGQGKCWWSSVKSANGWFLWYGYQRSTKPSQLMITEYRSWCWSLFPGAPWNAAQLNGSILGAALNSRILKFLSLACKQTKHIEHSYSITALPR